MSETLTPPIAPTDASMTTLAGSFFSIKAANKAILLQPPLLLPEHDDSTGDDVISNLRQVNDALQKAQAHATHWQTDVSINVQNQLQQIVVQADFSSSIGEPLEEVVSRLQTMSKDNLSSIRSTLDEIHDYAEALADNINSILYGSGKTIADYIGDDYPTHTIYGSYKQLGEYQKAVTDDHNNFSDYLNKLLSDDKGIDEEIKNLNSNIESYRQAISNDQIMIAGGSAAIVTGVVLVVVGVLLVPESGAVGVGIAVVGVAAIAGGAAADIYGIVDLVKKEDKIVAAKRRIQELDSDKAAMISIKDGSQGMVDHTASIYKALDQIVTNWQQMQNDVQNTMIAIRSIDDPTGLLQKWIVAAQGADAKMSPSAMYNILQAKLVAPGNSWADAAQKATALLNGLANSVEKTLPANTVITQDTINAAAVNRAA